MRKNAPEEYYHIFNRGMQKQLIFGNDTDRIRLLFLILTFQGSTQIKNISRTIRESVQHSMLHISPSLIKDIVDHHMVELISFTFMDNHFHMIIREVTEGGVSKYMQRILNSYTKYFNARYQKSGHLFQSSYKSVHIETDVQLLHTSVYLHKNCLEIEEWKDAIELYPWSSYQDCIGKNRWGPLLVTGPILDRFTDPSEYKKFVDSNPTKEHFKKSNDQNDQH